jgi:hypothetical protein
VVLKPYDGNHGRGVSLNLSTEADIAAAYDLAAEEGDSSSVIVERFIVGDEHRLLVVGRRMVAAAAGESLWVTATANPPSWNCATRRSTPTRAVAKPKNSHWVWSSREIRRDRAGTAAPGLTRNPCRPTA